MSKPILVTGGTGFLGSTLIRALVAQGEKVVLLKRSFSRTRRIDDLIEQKRIECFDLDRGDLHEVFSRWPIETIAHCATDYGRKDVAAYTVIEANLLLPLKLLELGKAHGVRAFINTDTILDKRISHYSLSKRQFSDWLQAFSSDLVGVNFALEHFYGPGDDRSKFVSKMCWSLVNSVPELDLTPGEQRRDFIYIDDVIEGLLKVMGHARTLSSGFYRYQVGSGRPLAIQEFMRLLQRLAKNSKTKLKWGALPYRENEVMDSIVDTSALRALGWTPRVTLEEGLLKTIAFDEKELVHP